jgi:predicted Mrr-cat superfamily restriction endonuclease
MADEDIIEKLASASVYDMDIMTFSAAECNQMLSMLRKAEARGMREAAVIAVAGKLKFLEDRTPIIVARSEDKIATAIIAAATKIMEEESRD